MIPTIIPSNDPAFRFVNDGEDVSIRMFDTETDRADIVFIDLRREDRGWQWFVEGQSVNYPSEWQWPLTAPHTFPTLKECGEDAISHIKNYCSRTGDQTWFPAIGRIENFLFLNTRPGTCSRGYEMDV